MAEMTFWTDPAFSVAFLGLETLSLQYWLTVPSPSPRPPVLNIYETLWVLFTALSFVISVQMLINIPHWDVPDIKDIPGLFPSLGLEGHPCIQLA